MKIMKVDNSVIKKLSNKAQEQLQDFIEKYQISKADKDEIQMSRIKGIFYGYITALEDLDIIDLQDFFKILAIIDSL